MSLTSLPIELRYHIFSHLLPIPPASTQSRRYVKEFDPTPRSISCRIWQSSIPLNLLLICRSLYHEVNAYHISTTGHLYLPIDNYNLGDLETERKPRLSEMDPKTSDATETRGEWQSRALHAGTSMRHRPSYSVYELADLDKNPLRKVVIELRRLTCPFHPTVSRYRHFNWAIPQSSYAIAYSQLLSAFLTPLSIRPVEFNITRLTIVAPGFFGYYSLPNHSGIVSDEDNKHEQGWYEKCIVKPFGLLKGKVEILEVVFLKNYKHLAQSLSVRMDWEQNIGEAGLFMMEEIVQELRELLGLSENRVKWRCEKEDRKGIGKIVCFCGARMCRVCSQV